MVDPNQLSFHRTFEAGFGTMSNKSSVSGKEFSLHVKKRTGKGPPEDYASLLGINEQNLDTPIIFNQEYVYNQPGDILVVDFIAYILNNVFKPNSPEVVAIEMIVKLLELYRDKGGFRYQAEAILINILNCRWLRRNNSTYQRGRRIIFKTECLEHHFELPDNIEFPKLSQIKVDDSDAIKECIDFIESRMCQSDVSRWLKVKVEILVGKGLNIFPAQEMNSDDKSQSKKNRKGRTFMKGVDEHTGREDIPLIDERHILYALFTSDVSYDDYKKDGKENIINHDDVQPINNNVSGFSYCLFSHKRSFAKGNCHYNYQREMETLIKELEAVESPESIPWHIHYLVTNYIKGGLFGEKAE